MNGQRARIDAVDAGNTVRLEIFIERLRSSEVRRLGQVADHQSREKQSPRLDILGVDTIVADLGGR